jgi:hypothetical protein
VACKRACGYWEFGEVFTLFVGVVFEEGFVDRRNFAHGSEEDHFAGELALVVVNILFGLNIYINDIAGGGVRREGRPWRSLHGEERGVWRNLTRPGIQLLPAEAEFTLVPEVGVFHADFSELVAGPLVGLFEIWRAGKSRPDPVHECGGKLHNM